MKGKKILVIDDEEDSRRLIKITLESAGAQVFTAANAHQGMHDAGQIDLDLILLDLKMPDVDGMAILRTLTATRAPCPIVVLSGVDSRNITVQAITDGAFGFIHKPISHHTFADQIAQILKWSANEDPES
ncbi:MAG: response regulator [Leptospirales bacterium]|nr:response regulator [Leptospirales bacterium]